MSNDTYLDRKFVFAAIIIGFCYITITLTVGAIFGKDAAGIAGASLTALAIGILTKFKSLRFSKRKVKHKEIGINITKVNFYNVILIIFSAFGIQLLFGILLSIVLRYINFRTADYDSFFEFLDNTWLSVTLIFINILTFFITGYLYSKTSNELNYTGSIIAATCIIIINTLIAIVIFVLAAVPLTDSRQPFLQILPFCIFWLFYIGIMLLGTYLGFRNRKFVRID